jgi:dihydropteroate synthase
VSLPPRQSFHIPLSSGRALELGSRTLVMAIVNVTPDSFADGGLRFDPDVAIHDGVRFVEEGADILDVGGESTRPGAAPLAAEEELRRVIPVVEGLQRRVNVPISIDTYKAVVAERALDAGAAIVNDVSALAYDPALAGVVAARRAAVVLMHNRGRSSDMYRLARYDDVAAEVRDELEAAIRRAETAGIDRERIIVDPGLGFAKRAEHSFETLARLEELARIDRPILVGPSRKSFLRESVGDIPPQQRDWATAATVAAAVMFGAHIVRVHEVKGMVDVVRTADEIGRWLRGSVVSQLRGS